MTKTISKSIKSSRISSNLSSKQAHIEHRIRHRVTLGIGFVIIAALLGLVLTLVIIPRVTDSIRLNRINSIYSSIKLPSNTYFNTENVFGDKRPYEWDTSRTYASSKTFVVAKTVKDTFTEIDAAIKAAGYTPFEEAYPDSTSRELHYKTDKGEYIRLNVTSKYRNDVGSSEIIMNGKYDDAFLKIDPNVGPSTVTLKVNLDDNNE